MKTIFTIKLNEYGNGVIPLVLTEESSIPTELIPLETVRQAKEVVWGKYGSDAKYIPQRAFQTIIERRAIHTPDTIQLIENQGLTPSLSVVYGSVLRPMSASWARIPDAVFIQCEDTSKIGSCHTYVVVPQDLEEEVIDNYQLLFISRGEKTL